MIKQQDEAAMNLILNSTRQILESNHKYLQIADNFVKNYKTGSSTINKLETYLNQIKNKKEFEYEVGDLQGQCKVLEEKALELHSKYFSHIKQAPLRLTEQSIQHFIKFVIKGYQSGMQIDDSTMCNAIISLQKSNRLKSANVLLFKCYELIYLNKKYKKERYQNFIHINDLSSVSGKRKLSYNPKFDIKSVINRVGNAMKNLDKEEDNHPNSNLKQAVEEYNKIRNIEYTKKWIKSPRICIDEMKRCKDIYEFKILCYAYRGIALTLQLLIQQINLTSFNPSLQYFFNIIIENNKVIQRALIYGELANKIKDLTCALTPLEYSQRDRSKMVYHDKLISYQNNIYKLDTCQVEYEDDDDQEIRTITRNEEQVQSLFCEHFGDIFDKGVDELTYKFYLMFLTSGQSFQQWIQNI